MPTFKFRRGTAIDWNERNPILYSGEVGYELDTGAFKIGDGRHRWVDLGYYRDWDDTRALIEQKITELEGHVIGVSEATFNEHVVSEEPHPFYDDGRDLTLLYLNAKV